MSVPELLIHFLLAGASLAFIWWLFGRHRWKRLPENLRRGLFRLYVAVCVPWLAWYGFIAFDAAKHHYNYGRYVSGAAWQDRGRTPPLRQQVGGPTFEAISPPLC